MNERKALYRQLQHYFETQLFGLYRWHSVAHREAEKVTVERDARGHRINQRSFGQLVEKAVIEFDGYTLSLSSPNEVEDDPTRALLLYDGVPQPDNLVVSGPNAKGTWDEITLVLRDNIEKGKNHGSQAGSSGG